MPKIILKFRDTILQEIPIRKTCVSIGRTPDNDVIINNLGVSRQHASIKKEDEDFVLEDMGSQNGTLLNGQEITKVKLQDKDQIIIGKHSLIFLLHADSGPIKEEKIPQAQRKVPTFSAEETLRLKTVSGESKQSKDKDHEKTAEMRREVGVEIIEGGIDQTIVKFERLLMVAGKGSKVDIKLKGDFEREVVFVISNRPTGFFISPPKEVPVKVNGELIKDYSKLQDGTIIEAGETKMKFFLRFYE